MWRKFVLYEHCRFSQVGNRFLRGDLVLRVLMLSKACIVGAYQRKLEELAAIPGVELLVAVPPYWRDERGATPLERTYTVGYRLETLPMALNGNFHLHFYPTLGRMLRYERPDIVHIDEEPYNLATFHANILARRLGAKTLWFSWQNLYRRYPWPFSAMERYNLQHVDYALMGSPTAAAVWKQKGYQGAFAILPQFGVDPELFSPPALPRPLGSVHLAYVGRLVPEKGVDLFIEALRGLEGAWHTTILGSGPEAARLLAQAQVGGIAERVRFCAALPSMEMPGFYRTVDVLVLPSRAQPNWAEQFGRVLIEAMACGAAVLGAATGEIPAVIGSAGLVFPEADVSALRAQLARLVNDNGLRRALAEAGRARVLTEFTQHRIAAETAHVYQAMLA